MFIDTHCHINMMVKQDFDRALTPSELSDAQHIINQAHHAGVTRIINVGTSLIESKNCIALAQKYPAIFAAIGIHPNDCTPQWHDDLKELKTVLKNTPAEFIVGIGECGLDFHYDDYNEARQRDAFKAQIELALEFDRALIVHTRDAADETLKIIEEFKGQISRGIIHCFSEDQAFADYAIELGFALGIGGTITYPKNNVLRSVCQTVELSSIVLETDAPFLPPQYMRGKQNNPAQVAHVAQELATLRNVSVDEVAQKTTARANEIFRLP